MKTKIALILVLLSALLVTGCQINIPPRFARQVLGSGHVITENRQVSEYNAISLKGVGDLRITQGEKESLSVEAEDNLMPLIETRVQNGTLIIGFDDDAWTGVRPTRPIRFNLGVRDLNAIIVDGAANVQAADLKSGRLALTIRGAGNIKIENLIADQVTTTMGGAGNIELAGQVTRQQASVDGVGRYGAARLDSQSATVTLNGVGGATLWAKEDLAVSIHGGGSVDYYGSPRVAQTITGLGGVRRLGDK